jgi:adenosylhomocysteinase
MPMESFERVRLDAYFAKIATRFTPEAQATTFLITHLLSERPGFVRAVAAMSRLRAVLPKPKSVNPAARHEVEQTVPVDALSRELFTDPDLGSAAAGGSRHVDHVNMQVTELPGSGKRENA